MIGSLTFAALISLVLSAVTPPVAAQDTRPVVVELFTSQGCSACPPADAFLSVLAARDDVIALGLHVDYWDYIGWKDAFASPAFSARQKAYSRAAGRRAIYTPQMIIGGAADVVGTHPMDVTDQIDAFRKAPETVKLSIRRAGAELVEVDAQALTSFAAPLLVQVVRYRPEASVKIERGENAGHRIAYSNIVTDWQIAAEWDASHPFRGRIAAKGDLPVVVLIQQQGPGRIEAAAQLR